MTGAPGEGRLKVLVVEDDDAVRRVAALTLRVAGIEVVQAADGEAALEVFRQQADEIDCVLLDLGLPGIGGEETFDRLLEIRNDVPIVVATGSIDESALAELKRRGARGVIEKPASIDEILGVVREATGAPGHREI